MEITAGNFNQESRGGGLKFLFILFLLLFVGGITIAFLFPLLPDMHDTARHGGDVYEVLDCLQKNGTLELWHRKTDNRYAKICLLSDGEKAGKFGVKIETELSHRITAFIKEKLNSLWQVERYLGNSGYECVSGCEGITPGVPR